MPRIHLSDEELYAIRCLMHQMNELDERGEANVYAVSLEKMRQHVQMIERKSRAAASEDRLGKILGTYRLKTLEMDWVRAMRAVTADCPTSRISAYANGDKALHLYDSRFDKEIAELQAVKKWSFENAVTYLGAGFVRIKTPFIIHPSK